MDNKKALALGILLLLVVQTAGFTESNSYFHIYDLAHEAYLVSGLKVFPPGLYHNKEKAEKLPQNAQWRFEPAEKIKGVQYYYIVDRLYGTAIAGGDNYDGDIYLYDNYRGKRNAQWKATEKNFENGQFPFVFTDGKHKRDLVAGARYDRHIYHQSAGEKSNGRWVVELVSKGTQGPDFFVVEQELINIEYHRNEAKELGDSNLFMIKRQRVPNNTEVTQTIDVGKSTKEITEQSWWFERAVTMSIYQSISVSGGFPGGVQTESKTEIGWEETKEWGEKNTHRVENELTWTIPTVVPPHSVVEVSAVLTKVIKNIPFTATIENTLGSGEKKRITVEGMCRAVEYVSGDISFNQTK